VTSSQAEAWAMSEQQVTPFGGFPPSCTNLDKEGKATTPRKMSAVRYQELTQSLTALDWKKKKGHKMTKGW